MPRAGLDTQAVLKAAVEIADRDGVGAVTLSTIAQVLGVKSPSLYNHISGLDSLKSMLAAYALELLYEHVSGAAASSTGKSAIVQFAHTYLDFARKHPGLYEAAQAVPDVRDEAILTSGDKIVSLALDLLQHYGMPETESLHAVRGLRSLVHGFASLEKSGGFGLPLEVIDSFEFTLNIFLEGLQKNNPRKE